MGSCACIKPRAHGQTTLVQVNTRKDAKYSLKASYVEIYNENVFDLIHFKQKSLPVKWDATYGFYVQVGVWRPPCAAAPAECLIDSPGGRPLFVISPLLPADGTPRAMATSSRLARAAQGLKVVPCGQSRTMMEVIRTGMKHRRVGSHQLNMESSRSHSIMTVYCDATPTGARARAPGAIEGTRAMGITYEWARRRVYSTAPLNRT